MMMIMMMVIVPILVTLVGIVTVVTSVQSVKAVSAMVVYFVGIATAPEGQPNQAAYDITDDGIIDDGSDVPAKALPPI